MSDAVCHAWLESNEADTKLFHFYCGMVKSNEKRTMVEKVLNISTLSNHWYHSDQDRSQGPDRDVTGWISRIQREIAFFIIFILVVQFYIIYVEIKYILDVTKFEMYLIC